MSEKLKPCPFCGGPPLEAFPEGERMVGCNNVYCEMGDAKFWPETWNTRHLTPAQEHAEELVEALENLIAGFIEEMCGDMTPSEILGHPDIVKARAILTKIGGTDEVPG